MNTVKIFDELTYQAHDVDENEKAVMAEGELHNSLYPKEVNNDDVITVVAAAEIAKRNGARFYVYDEVNDCYWLSRLPEEGDDEKPMDAIW